jgi:hypothetical protein
MYSLDQKPIFEHITLIGIDSAATSGSHVSQ